MYFKPLSILYGVLSITACVQAATAGALSVSKDQRYIVQLKPSTDVDSFVPSLLKDIFDLIGDDDVNAMANPVTVFDSFDIDGGFKAISTKIEKDSLLGAMLGYFDDIVTIVPDEKIKFDLPKPQSSRRRRGAEKRRIQSPALESNGTAGLVEQKGATWSLTRVSQRKADTSAPYVYPESAGEGVYVYVMDNGVYKDHSDFSGRASWGFSAVGNDTVTQNGGGHGTHVAGIIGGDNYGVAKKATIVSVQVLNLDGEGSMSDLLAGLDWTVKDVKKHGKKAVVNMSLGAPSSAPGTDTLNQAISAAAKGGLPIIVAAGNSGSDACDITPAGNPDVFTVAASDKTDALDPRSCYGKCVDVTAPGIEVESDYIGGKDKTEVLSGTSMAAPHLTGIAALLLNDLSDASPKALFEALTSIATKDVVKNNRPATPNLMAFNRKE